MGQKITPRRTKSLISPVWNRILNIWAIFFELTQIGKKCIKNYFVFFITWCWSFRNEHWLGTIKVTPKIEKKITIFNNIWCVNNLIQIAVFLNISWFCTTLYCTSPNFLTLKVATYLKKRKLLLKVVRPSIRFKTDLCSLPTISQQLFIFPILVNRERVLLVKSCLCKESNEEFNNYFRLFENKYNKTRYNSKSMKLPPVKLELAKQGFYFSIGVLYNSLPIEIKDTDGYGNFKELVKAHFS